MKINAYVDFCKPGDCDNLRTWALWAFVIPIRKFGEVYLRIFGLEFILRWE